jgi:hypothetical protein
MDCGPQLQPEREQEMANKLDVSTEDVSIQLDEMKKDIAKGIPGVRGPAPFDPYKPLRDGTPKREKHAKFLNRLREALWFHDLLVGFGVAKDFMIVFGLAEELNKLSQGETVNWLYWPAELDTNGNVKHDENGQIKLRAKPYNLEVKRTTDANVEDFKPRNRTNYGWVWNDRRKQWVWSAISG